MGKSGVMGSPKRSTSTLQLSSGPMGTDSSIIWGMTSSSLFMAASALAFFSSRRVMRSALAFTAALLASISA